VQGLRHRERRQCSDRNPQRQDQLKAVAVNAFADLRHRSGNAVLFVRHAAGVAREGRDADLSQLPGEDNPSHGAARSVWNGAQIG